MAEWREKYSVYTLQLIKEGTMNIVIDWDPVAGSRLGAGYRITFNGVRLKKNIVDLEEAKQAGLKLAMNLLTRAVAKIRKADTKNVTELGNNLPF